MINEQKDLSQSIVELSWIAIANHKRHNRYKYVTYLHFVHH